MIRLQDIADMAGVSRTTVSNVINGNTKRVSQATIDKITAILKEQNYVPHMGSVMLSGHGSKIIGAVLGFERAHGMQALQDPFVGELIGTLQMEAEEKGYYVMLIGGEDIQNVGVDDYSGGYQIGEYLDSCGYHKALFISETGKDSDYYRWMGFKQAMEKNGRFCSKSRLMVVSSKRMQRLHEYEELLPRFLEAKALAFSSDFSAIEAINFFVDHKISIPDQISVTGFDDSIYASLVRPKLTTVHQDVSQKAHKRDIKVLMDLVVNHTSDEHNWFIESRKSKDNPYRDYYIWKDPVNGKEPNNWGGVFGGSAWEYDEKTQMYYLHLFSKKQPDLNWENEKVRREVYDMMTFWCEKGIDGFRMDVISMISKNQAFPDGEVKNGLYGDFNPYCVHGPRIHEFLQEMNKEVLSRYDIMTVGETSGVTIEEAQKYAGEDRNELNMVFQFEHVEDACGDYGKWTTAKFNFRDFKKTMIKWQEELQGKAWNSLFLGNHDQPRSVSRFGNDNPAYRETSAKMLATCLHMMQGTPYVYQGEELGMTNAYFDKLEDYRDIESINFFAELTEAGIMTPEYMMKCLMLRSRDNARTPMQWNDSAQGGFTSGEPWIRINSNYKEINAAQQLGDPASVFHYYQKLICLRKEKEIIVYGSFEALCRDDDKIFAYTRKLDQKKLLTACNFSDQDAEMEIPEEFAGAQCLITNLGRTVFDRNFVLRPYEAFVLYKE